MSGDVVKFHHAPGRVYKVVFGANGAPKRITVEYTRESPLCGERHKLRKAVDPTKKTGLAILAAIARGEQGEAVGHA